MTRYQALLLSLPTRSSTTRMRIWRTLKSTGCGVLRDGVYIVPAEAPQAGALGELESLVKAEGGFAMTAGLDIDTPDLEQVRALFDRSGDYGTLVGKVKAAKAALPRLGKRKAETALRRLQGALEDLAAIDFYPGQAAAQAKEAVAMLERETHASYSGDEPRASGAKVRRLDPARYRARTWATRKDPWVDRLASAWLIKRFIDKDAAFLWIERPADCPKRAIGFDFDGATFTHSGQRVTFEVLVASFGLAQNAALISLGAAVHFLDIGGIPVPDATGLETVLSGVRKKARSDDERLKEAMRIFDLFYSAYEQRFAKQG
jgi:hypothetical protein